MAAVEVAEHIGRSIGAVEAVRWGVHEWHGNGNVTALNRMMLAHLRKQRGQSTCAKCGGMV
jgi:hypothetical protein